jgi:hypothetical protein
MLGCDKLKQDCQPQKIGGFSELVYTICRRGSFAMSRFFTAQEMEHLCISEYFGCLRLDESMEKYLIGILIFVKVLVFNMFLQPHKFDNLNFPKHKQPLKNNMYILSSVYYRIIC